MASILRIHQGRSSGNNVSGQLKRSVLYFPPVYSNRETQDNIIKQFWNSECVFTKDLKGQCSSALKAAGYSRTVGSLTFRSVLLLVVLFEEINVV